MMPLARPAHDNQGPRRPSRLQSEVGLAVDEQGAAPVAGRRAGAPRVEGRGLESRVGGRGSRVDGRVGDSSLPSYGPRRKEAAVGAATAQGEVR